MQEVVHKKMKTFILVEINRWYKGRNTLSYDAVRASFTIFRGQSYLCENIQGLAVQSRATKINCAWAVYNYRNVI